MSRRRRRGIRRGMFKINTFNSRQEERKGGGGFGCMSPKRESGK